MHHVMFDIDGTLVESYDFDTLCFSEAVQEVTGVAIDTDWSRYKHVTDSGILNEFFEECKALDAMAMKSDIKQLFLSKIAARIDKRAIKEVRGASAFLAKLQTFDDVLISFATGGWCESAALKLTSAGIDFSNIPIASSNDHHSRIEIMRIAQNLVAGGAVAPVTYFGDGSWDLKACEELGVNFVLVGGKTKHNQSIKDFTVQTEAFAHIVLHRR